MQHRVMNDTIPLAVVNSRTTHNVRKYSKGLQLTGNPSTNILR